MMMNGLFKIFRGKGGTPSVVFRRMTPTFSHPCGARVATRPTLRGIFPKESLEEALYYLILQFLLNLNLCERLQDVTSLYVVVVDE